MFTGIVTDLGRVRSVEQRGDRRVVIETHYDTDGIDIGASVACSGVCLTVVDKGPDWFAVDVSEATASVTSLGAWQAGGAVNLERSLRVGDELGGHIVTGHVDAVGAIAEIVPEGDSKRFVFEVPARLAPLISPKGSIAVDGVSLTVNDVVDGQDATHVAVNIIPHTQAVTAFASAKAGDPVNIEIDVLARYVARLNAKG